MISFKRKACVSRVSEKDTNRYDAARRSPARTAICDGRHATVMHLVVSWFVSTGTFDFKVLIKDRLCTRRGILSMFNSVHDLLEWQLWQLLPGMLFHQDLEPKGLEWGDKILENRLIP